MQTSHPTSESLPSLSDDSLDTVTGGKARAADRGSLDSATELALTNLSSDIKDLAKPSQQSPQLTTMMMFAMMARR